MFLLQITHKPQQFSNYMFVKSCKIPTTIKQMKDVIGETQPWKHAWYAKGENSLFCYSPLSEDRKNYVNSPKELLQAFRSKDEQIITVTYPNGVYTFYIVEGSE